MNTEYSKFLELQMYHTYFRDELFKTVKVKPTAWTRNALNVLKLIFKQHENGMTIYHSSEKTAQEVLDFIAKEYGIDKLEFDITTNDSNIYSYTDFSLDKLGKLKFSNRPASPGFDSRAVGLTLLDPAENIIDNFGSIFLYLKDMNEQLTKNGQIIFDLVFNARKTQWNYTIISETEMEGLVIESTSNIKLTGPEKIKLNKGQYGYKFTSGSQLLPLHESKNYKFDLFQEVLLPSNEISKRLIVPNLPNPSVQGIRPIYLNGTSEAASSMFVYV